MREREYRSKREELERMLNDPAMPIEPARVWSLLAKIERADVAVSDRFG